jgi:hypothetical protein
MSRLEQEKALVARQIERAEERLKGMLKVYGEIGRVHNARICAEGKRLAALLDQRKALEEADA